MLAQGQIQVQVEVEVQVQVQVQVEAAGGAVRAAFPIRNTYTAPSTRLRHPERTEKNQIVPGQQSAAVVVRKFMDVKKEMGSKKSTPNPGGYERL